MFYLLMFFTGWRSSVHHCVKWCGQLLCDSAAAAAAAANDNESDVDDDWSACAVLQTAGARMRVYSEVVCLTTMIASWSRGLLLAYGCPGGAENGGPICRHEIARHESDLSGNWINWVDLDLALLTWFPLLRRFEKYPKLKYILTFNVINRLQQAQNGLIASSVFCIDPL